MNIQQAYRQLLQKLQTVYDSREAGNIVNLVIENITGKSKIDRIVYKETPISKEQEGTLEKITTDLLQHRPVQYVLGEAWFANLKFFVNEQVLIPRPETEELVEWIVLEMENRKSKIENKMHVLDVGTGSGCIPIILKKKFPFANVSAIDISEGAIDVAKRNANDLQAEIHFHTLDFLEKENWKQLGNFDLIVSNPPYIKQLEESQMRQNVLRYEPHVALFVPNNDALIFYEALAEFGKNHLTANGLIFMEINESLAAEVKDLFLRNGYKNIAVKKDLQGKERMVRVSSF